MKPNKKTQELQVKFMTNFWSWVGRFEQSNKCTIKVNIEDLEIAEKFPPIGILGKSRTKKYNFTPR